MTTPDLPAFGLRPNRPRRTRAHAYLAPLLGRASREVVPGSARGHVSAPALRPALDPAVEPHVAHHVPAHSESPSAHHASAGVVVFEWAVRVIMLAVLASVLYFAVTANWLGSAATSFGNWYGESVAPATGLDLDNARTDPASITTPDGTAVRTGQ